MPESLNILQQVDKLFPLAEVVILDEPIELPSRTKETIQIIGEMIREVIGNETDMNEALITISKTIYAGNYHIDSMYDCYDIKKLIAYPYVNLTFKEAEASVQLVKKINERLEKMN